MFYAGESNVPGAPGNLMAGSPGYFLPEEEIQKRMQERYYQTPAGQNLMQRQNKLKEKIKTGQFFPTAMGLDSSPIVAQYYPGTQAVGNMGGMIGQPSQFGFDGKYVS